jgi:hypothetical protein
MLPNFWPGNDRVRPASPGFFGCRGLWHRSYQRRFVGPRLICGAAVILPGITDSNVQAPLSNGYNRGHAFSAERIGVCNSVFFNDHSILVERGKWRRRRCFERSARFTPPYAHSIGSDRRLSSGGRLWNYYLDLRGCRLGPSYGNDRSAAVADPSGRTLLSEGVRLRSKGSQYRLESRLPLGRYRRALPGQRCRVRVPFPEGIAPPQTR